jgi:hypothetical protein
MMQDTKLRDGFRGYLRPGGALVSVFTACFTAIISEFFPHSVCIDYVNFFAEMLIILVNVSSLLMYLRSRNRILENNLDEFCA